MVIEIETDLHSLQLLRVLKDIEQELGREVSYRWGPRIIDLDILLFEDIVLNKDNLKIPHPLIARKGFCLETFERNRTECKTSLA